MEWITFQEKKPEPGQEILVLFVDKAIIAVNTLRGLKELPTHWMPRPPDPVKKRWHPKDGEYYYAISNLGGCAIDNWSECAVDSKRRNTFGVYKTKEEAEIMRGKIKDFVTKEIGKV